MELIIINMRLFQYEWLESTKYFTRNILDTKTP